MRSSWSLKRVLTRLRTRKLVAVACYLGIVSLLMMAWSAAFTVFRLTDRWKANLE